MKLEAITPDAGILDAARLNSAIFRDSSGVSPPVAAGRERLVRHMGYPGFHGFVLWTDEGHPVGFGYGYRSIPGQFYRTLLEAELPAGVREEWLADCFEFVALGVLLEHRRRGYGRILHDTVLQAAGERTAVLTTEVSNRASRALYASLGWQLLASSFQPPNALEPFVIMARSLRETGSR